jgi:hypothetical protein
MIYIYNSFINYLFDDAINLIIFFYYKLKSEVLQNNIQ